MGGVAGAAGQNPLTDAGLSEPHWLIGGNAVLTVAADAPTIWLVSIDDPAARRRADVVAISAAEVAEAAPHVDAGERLLRRKLAKLLLAEAGGCRPGDVTVDRDAHGGPIVKAPAGWHLSIAARWPDCAIGIACSPLGVDLEQVTDEPPPLDLLTVAEREWLVRLSPADQPCAFAACWAAKEAHAKWTGQPRALDPAAIATTTLPYRHAGHGGRVTSHYGTTCCWLREAADHVAAVCTA